MEVKLMVNGLGERLQTLRNSYKLSQKEVAVAIGVSPSLSSNYEKSERTPSAESLMALANLYHCSTDYLLGIDKKISDKSIDCSMLSDEQFSMLFNFLQSLL